METSKERTEAFLKDLNELLNKHGAEIMTEEIGRKAYMPGTWIISVVLNGVYDTNEFNEYECLKEYTEIDLGTFIDGKD